MKGLYQIYYSFKRLLSEPKPILLQLLSYAIIILILGSAFSEAFEVASLDAVDVLYLNDDKEGTGKIVIDNMLETDEINELIKLKATDSKKEAKKKIEDGDAQAFLYIPENFSDEDNKEKNIEIYMLESASVGSLIVKDVTDSFVNALNTATVVYKYVDPSQKFERASYESVKEDTVSKDFAPDSMTYYSIAMILMMLLVGANYGRVAITDYYLGTLGDRMKLSPMNTLEQYAGTIFGYSLVAFLQAVCMMVFTQVLFHTNWGDNIGLVLFVMFSYAIMTNVLGAMLCCVTLNDEKASKLITVCVIAFTFLAGGFVAADFGQLTSLSPSFYARNALFNIIYKGDMNTVWSNIGTIWMLVIVFTVISIVALRRKKA